MDTARQLANIELRDTQDGLVRLGELWAEAPRVVVFIRHYG
jgi:hypothetical protein